MVHYSDFHVDSRIQRQARALAERGDVVDCVCLSEPDQIEVGSGSIRLHRVPIRRQRGGALAYLSGYGRFFAGALRRVSVLDRVQAFDFVEVHNMPDFLTLCALRPKLRGAPVALNVHDTFPELFATMFDLSTHHPLVRAARVEERLSARVADAMLFVTDEARALLAGRGVESARARVVMNSPDEQVFGVRREPVPPPAGGPLRLVYHGGLAPRFGVESLVRAVGLAPDTDLSLDVYGPDPERAAALATLAREAAPGRVEVAPNATPVDRIPGKLAQAHVGVVPTLRDPFTELLLPVKLLEYVHMGLPVVCSRLPVIERYFSDRELLFTEPGSSASIARALALVRADPAAAAERARRASARLEQIEWARQREGYLSLVDEVVGARNGA
jgi:glycosyltransferase involved in cell wall biosynthesis